MILVGETGRSQVRVLHWMQGRPAEAANDQMRYSYDDLSQSCNLEVDNQGQIISLEEYYPFGGTAVLTGRNQVEASYKVIRYSGKECDASGLYYYGFRYYQPWVGRWLSADPAGDADGMNLYRMVSNNPATLVDDQGLMGKKKKKHSEPLNLSSTVPPTSTSATQRSSGVNPWQLGERMQRAPGEASSNAVPNINTSPLLSSTLTPLSTVQLPGPSRAMVSQSPPINEDDGFTTVRSPRRGSSHSIASSTGSVRSARSTGGSPLYAISGEKAFAELMSQLKQRVSKTDDIHAIGRRRKIDNTRNYFYLRTRPDNSGYSHILQPQKIAEYQKAGISEKDIIPAIMMALITGEEVAIQNAQHERQGRPIYKFEFQGNTQFIAISLGYEAGNSNAQSVIGANISSERDVDYHNQRNRTKQPTGLRKKFASLSFTK